MMKVPGASLKSQNLVRCAFKHDQIDEFLLYENVPDDEIDSLLNISNNGCIYTYTVVFTHIHTLFLLYDFTWFLYPVIANIFLI